MTSNSEPAEPAPFPQWRLSGFYLAYYAALGAFTPYWSLFLKARGHDIAAISVLMSLWYATRIVAPSSWGWLAARSARPVRWLRIGCALTLASFAVFLMPLGFAATFIAMCAFCAFYNAVMPQFEALTLSHLDGRTERYGRIRVWGSVGFIGTVVAFGVLFDHVSILWLPAFMLPLFATLLAGSIVNDYARAPLVAPDEDSEGFTARLRRPEVVAFFVVALLVQLSFGPHYTFFSIYLEELGYSASALGIYWGVAVGVEILMFFASARLLRHWSAAGLLMASLLAAVVRWTITALWPREIMLMGFAQALHALCFAAFFAASMQYMARFFPGRMNGHGQGIFYGFSSGVGGVLGALLSGLVWQHGGGRLAFLLAAAVAAMAAVIAWTWLRPRRGG
ncbi:MAG: MFS transporter [Xanthomonadales bacterium]|nr:MFS transporter [Xanthomonadales bacterium]